MKLRKAYKYQDDAIAYCRDNARAVLRAFAGAGKCLITLRVFREMSCVKPLLVVSPASLILNWYDEVAKENLNKDNFLVISYEKFTKIVNGFDDAALKGWMHSFCAMVFDESQKLMTPDSLRSLAAIRAQKYIAKVLFLSATPFSKSAKDVYVTLSICMPGQIGTVGKFCSTFCKLEYDRFAKRQVYKGFKDLEGLSALMSKCSFRIEKDEVVGQLPELRFSELYLSVNTDLGAIPNDSSIMKKDPLISDLRQVAARLKIAPYVRSLKDRGINKGLIFTWHKEPADKLSYALPGKSEIISGDVDMRERYRRIDDFQSGKIDWLVLTIAAAGQGLNLQAANYVGFLETGFVYAEIEQCVSRAHRTGSKHESVLAEFVLLSGSIDIPIYKIVMGRKETIETITER